MPRAGFRSGTVVDGAPAHRGGAAGEAGPVTRARGNPLPSARSGGNRCPAAGGLTVCAPGMPPAPVVGMSRLVMNGRAPEASSVPDVVLPAQLPRAHGVPPSQRLMLAVLEDAVGEYRRLGQG